MLAHWFLIQEKTQDVYFEMKKFLPQLKVFYLPFLLMHYHHKKENFDLLAKYSHYYEGVKIFCGVTFHFLIQVIFNFYQKKKSIESLENSSFYVEKKLSSRFHFLGSKWTLSCKEYRAFWFEKVKSATQFLFHTK